MMQGSKNVRQFPAGRVKGVFALSKQDTRKEQSPIERISAFIVDKRKAFYLLYIGVAIFCVFSSGWVSVNDDLTSYLPDTT